MSNRKWWIDKKDEFINQFNSGKSGKELAEYFKVSESSITRAISDLNLRIRLVSEGDFKGYKIDWSDKKEELE
jgi:predicted DNA-binding transcriptional regulator YafY